MADENAAADDSALAPELAAEAEALLAEVDAGEPLAPGAPAAEPQDAGLDTGAMLASLLQITFNNLIAPRRGEHWEMNADECAQLGQAYGAVIDKYFPDINAGPEVTAIMLSVMVFGPRIAADVANAQDDAPAVAQDDAQDDAQDAETPTGKTVPFGFDNPPA